MGSAVAFHLVMRAAAKVMCSVALIALVLPARSPQAAAAAEPVAVQMRNIALHIDAATIMNIRRLRG